MLLQQGQSLEPSVLRRTIEMVNADESPSEVLTSEVLTSSRGRTIRPKSSGQKRYVDAIRENVITFGLGPAGTGKSWLAVAMAVQALQSKQVERIILTRPAVEAGERLGFLPGDLMAKVDPYLRPLYDALYDMVETEGAQRLLDRGTVEVAPLAFMRGRTLNDSFIILDEAQNTTPEQMKMFLTRIGFGSKAVITGDTTQVDVAGGKSGVAGLETDAGRHRRAGVRAPVEHRRRAPPHRAGHRQRLRTGRWRRQLLDGPGRRAVTLRPPSPPTRRRAGGDGEVTVFVADEQAHHPVDVARWSALAERVLEAEGVRGEAELSVLFVDVDAITVLNRDFMGEEGPTDVLSFPIDGELAPGGRWPDDGGPGPDRGMPDPDDLPLLLGDVVICPEIAARNAPEHAGIVRRRDRAAGRARHPAPARARPPRRGRPRGHAGPRARAAAAVPRHSRPATRGP